MKTVISLLWLLCAAGHANPQTRTKPGTAVEQHIRDVIGQLSSSSLLKLELLGGARGDGVRQPWMDEMREHGIRTARVSVSIDYHRNGRPKRMSVQRTELFAGYEDTNPISDPKRLQAIADSGLTQILDQIAIERASHGFWVDVPNPRPRPFEGGVQVDLFDDEWLPVPPPMYCAGKACVHGD